MRPATREEIAMQAPNRIGLRSQLSRPQRIRLLVDRSRPREAHAIRRRTPAAGAPLYPATRTGTQEQRPSSRARDFLTSTAEPGVRGSFQAQIEDRSHAAVTQIARPTG